MNTQCHLLLEHRIFKYHSPDVLSPLGNPGGGGGIPPGGGGGGGAPPGGGGGGGGAIPGGGGGGGGGSPLPGGGGGGGGGGAAPPCGNIPGKGGGGGGPPPGRGGGIGGPLWGGSLRKSSSSASVRSVKSRLLTSKGPSFTSAGAYAQASSRLSSNGVCSRMTATSTVSTGAAISVAACGKRREGASNISHLPL